MMKHLHTTLSGDAGGTETFCRLWKRYANGPVVMLGRLNCRHQCSASALLSSTMWNPQIPAVATLSWLCKASFLQLQAGLVIESCSRWHFGTTYVIKARPGVSSINSWTDEHLQSLIVEAHKFLCLEKVILSRHVLACHCSGPNTLHHCSRNPSCFWVQGFLTK